MMTGRYPWAAGFYDMSEDTAHCTTNSTLLPQLLKPLGRLLGPACDFQEAVSDTGKPHRTTTRQQRPVTTCNR